jgi:hypothetical protein
MIAPLSITGLVEKAGTREQLEVKLVFNDNYPFAFPECSFTVGTS